MVISSSNCCRHNNSNKGQHFIIRINLGNRIGNGACVPIVTMNIAPKHFALLVLLLSHLEDKEQKLMQEIAKWKPS